MSTPPSTFTPRYQTLAKGYVSTGRVSSFTPISAPQAGSTQAVRLVPAQIGPKPEAQHPVPSHLNVSDLSKDMAAVKLSDNRPPPSKDPVREDHLEKVARDQFLQEQLDKVRKEADDAYMAMATRTVTAEEKLEEAEERFKVVVERLEATKQLLEDTEGKYEGLCHEFNSYMTDSDHRTQKMGTEIMNAREEVDKANARADAMVIEAKAKVVEAETRANAEVVEAKAKVVEAIESAKAVQKTLNETRNKQIIAQTRLQDAENKLSFWRWAFFAVVSMLVAICLARFF